MTLAIAILPIYAQVGVWAQVALLACRLVDDQLSRRKVDPTIVRYVNSFLSGSLTVVLVVAILGYFGVETTTFAAAIAARLQAVTPPADERAIAWASHELLDSGTPPRPARRA